MRLVLKAQQGHKVQLVRQDPKVQQAPLVLLVHKVQRVLQELLARKVLQVPKVQLELQELLGQEVRQAQVEGIVGI